MTATDTGTARKRGAAILIQTALLREFLKTWQGEFVMSSNLWLILYKNAIEGVISVTGSHYISRVPQHQVEKAKGISLLLFG